jgi:hypothetical protein
MRSIAALMIGVLIAGCGKPSDGPIDIKTDPYNLHVCAANRATIGIMVANDEWGLGLDVGGTVHGVVWPYRFSARREAGVALLIGREGEIWAREGNQLTAPGTMDEEGTLITCGLPHVMR